MTAQDTHRSRAPSSAPRVSTALGLAGVMLAACVCRATLTPHQPEQSRTGTAELTLAGQVDCARLLDLASQRLNITIQYDASVIKGSVTLRLGAPMSDTELWNLANRVLANQGFTTVRIAGEGLPVYSVVRMTDAAAVTELRQEPPREGDLAGFATLVVRAEHQPAKDLVEAVRPLLSRSGGSAAELGPSGLIVISDLVPRLVEAQKVLTLLDIPRIPPVVQEMPARNLPASVLAAALREVAAKRKAVSGHDLVGEIVAAPGGESLLLIAPEPDAATWRELITRLDQRESVQVVTYSPEGFAAEDVASLIESTIRGGSSAAADDRWRVVVDGLTESLIITATAHQHEIVRGVLARLAAAGSQDRRPMRSYTVRNRGVLELLGVLHGLLDAGALDRGDPGNEGLVPQLPVLSAPDIGRTGAATPGSRLPPPSVGLAPLERGDIGPVDPPPSSYEANARTGSSAPGVSLTITADEATNTLIAIGERGQLAQLERLIRQLDVRQPQVMLEVLLISLSDSEALSLGVELQKQLDLNGDSSATLSSLFGLANQSVGGSPMVGAAAGFTGLVLSPGNYSVVLRALETLNEGRAVSVPRVLVGNNQQGTFSSVLQQPIARTDSTTSITTTSFGGTADAGTIATVRPQIAAGDHLVLQYSVQLSAFVGTSAGVGLPPPKQSNSVQSTVTIPDGYTVVVGGVELTSEAEAESRVPGIGTVPLIGELFKNRNRNRSRDRFYVFIRADVLRHNGFEDLRYLSAADQDAAGLEDNWPVSAPRVIR